MDVISTLNREQSRELDRIAIEEFGIPSIILMENAGRSVVDYLLKIYNSEKIIICCGKGNNGGDGLVAARHLDNLNLPVEIYLFANPMDLKGDAKINYQISLKSKLKITTVNEDNLETILTHLPKQCFIIDALFGTGLQGSIQDPFNKIIQAINDLNCQVLSIDIPSGLDCDTGQPLRNAINATYTVTFTCLKKGFKNPEAKKFIGKVHVANIEIPKVLIKNCNNQF